MLEDKKFTNRQILKTAYWSSTEKNESDYNFDQEDLTHSINLYKKYSIEPESLSKVKCDFFIQKSFLIRHVIKQLDILLEQNGIFEMILIENKFHSGAFLSVDQVNYEFSLSTFGRYDLIEKESINGFVILKYQKKSNTIDIKDSISHWTFGIPSGGKNTDWIDELILTIVNQEIPNLEIIICGKYENKELIEKYDLRIIDDVVLQNDLRIPISHKKNKIINCAKHENICILHDRFLLPDKWYINMVEYGNYFDYLCLPTCDSQMNRFQVDWMEWSYPISDRFKRNKSLEYSKWSPNVIIQGGVVVGKRKLLKRHLLDERLFWGELEDIHFSKVAFLDGALINIDEKNAFISRSVNHNAKKINSHIMHKIKAHISWYYSLIKHGLLFETMVRKCNI